MNTRAVHGRTFRVAECIMSPFAEQGRS